MNDNQLHPIDVTIAHTDGCGNTGPTRALVELCADELSLPIRIEMVCVATEEESTLQRMHGSPTVLVNGLDLEPAMRGRDDYGFT